MAIVNVTTANTFEEWRVKSNELGTAIGDLTNLTEPLAGATNVIAALADHETRTEALDAIVGVEALWDAAGTYDTIREAVNKNHADIETLSNTAGIDLATNSLTGYNGPTPHTLVGILNDQYAFDGGDDETTNLNTTAQNLAGGVSEVNTKATTNLASIGTIGSLATAATNLVAAVNELHTEVNANTSAVGAIGTTYVAVAGDTMTGTLISPSSGLSGSTAGISAATLLTLGTGSGTAIQVDANQRIGIGKVAHASHKVDVSGLLNATTLSYGGTDIQTKFDARYLQLGENFEDAVGAMVTGNTESGGITVTYQDADGTLDFVIADDGHNHVIGNIDNFTEEVQDIVGGMVTGNTASGITVTYQDSDGTIDFDVNDPTITLTGAVTGSGTISNLGSVEIATSGASALKLDIYDVAGSQLF